MKKILITRKLIKSSEENALRLFDVKLNQEDKLLTKDQLIKESNNCDGILSSLTEKFDSDVIIYKVNYSSNPKRFLRDILSQGIYIDTTSTNWKIK